VPLSGKKNNHEMRRRAWAAGHLASWCRGQMRRPTRFTIRNKHWRTPGVPVRNIGDPRSAGETLDICYQIEPLISRKFSIVYYFPNHPFPDLLSGVYRDQGGHPSGCRMNRWLPFCLICRKPIFSNALITFLAGRGIIASIKQKLQLAGCQ